VALAALVVHGLGPAPFFPLAAVTVAAPLLFALSQRSWRDFGMAGRPAAGAGDGTPPVQATAPRRSRRQRRLWAGRREPGSPPVPYRRYLARLRESVPGRCERCSDLD
jgi:hypothetical protein